MIWLRTVPDPAKELMNSTRRPYAKPLLLKCRENAIVHYLAQDAEAIKITVCGRPSPWGKGSHGQIP
jgi:hypothetical protein